MKLLRSEQLSQLNTPNTKYGQDNFIFFIFFFFYFVRGRIWRPPNFGNCLIETGWTTNPTAPGELGRDDHHLLQSCIPGVSGIIDLGHIDVKL